MAEKKDCFAYKAAGKCAALTTMDCDNCGFYKKRGTECDTCRHKGKPSCTICRIKDKFYKW